MVGVWGMGKIVTIDLQSPNASNAGADTNEAIYPARQKELGIFIPEFSKFAEEKRMCYVRLSCSKMVFICSLQRSHHEFVEKNIIPNYWDISF